MNKNGKRNYKDQMRLMLLLKALIHNNKNKRKNKSLKNRMNKQKKLNKKHQRNKKNN